MYESEDASEDMCHPNLHFMLKLMWRTMDETDWSNILLQILVHNPPPPPYRLNFYQGMLGILFSKGIYKLEILATQYGPV